MTTFPVLLSMAIIDLLQLNIDDILFKFSLSAVSLSTAFSNKSKCCLKTVVMTFLDLPQSTLLGFLLVRFSLFLKFLNHLSPGSVSELNMFWRSIFLAMTQAKAFTAEIERGQLTDLVLQDGLFHIACFPALVVS